MMKKFREAVASVEGYLLRHAPKGMTPTIYTYQELTRQQKAPRRPWAGVMVSEVSFHSDLAGCSFMQVDVPWGIAVCGQTERCILAFIENWPEEEKQEELDRLSYCFQEDKKR